VCQGRRRRRPHRARGQWEESYGVMGRKGALTDYYYYYNSTAGPSRPLHLQRPASCMHAPREVPRSNPAQSARLKSSCCAQSAPWEVPGSSPARRRNCCCVKNGAWCSPCPSWTPQTACCGQRTSSESLRALKLKGAGASPGHVPRLHSPRLWVPMGCPPLIA
jgi:hypothetical protein